MRRHELLPRHRFHGSEHQRIRNLIEPQAAFHEATLVRHRGIVEAGDKARVAFKKPARVAFPARMFVDHRFGPPSRTRSLRLRQGARRTSSSPSPPSRLRRSPLKTVSVATSDRRLDTGQGWANRFRRLFQFSDESAVDASVMSARFPGESVN